MARGGGGGGGSREPGGGGGESRSNRTGREMIREGGGERGEEGGRE